MKTLELPQGYISWSQFDLWNKNKSEYKRRYFLGEKGYETKEMRFGGAFANIREKELDFGLTDLEEKFIHLPSYEIKDRKEIIKYSDNDVEFDIIIKPDSRTEDWTKISEDKTGKIEWTQERANSHGQLKFYAFAIFYSQGVNPEIVLNWVETKNTENGISFTGNAKSFFVKFTKKELLEFGNKIKETAIEINKAFYDFLQGSKNEIDNDLILEYEELIETQKIIEERLQSCKQRLENIFIEKNLDNLDVGFGTFYFTTKKKFVYPDVFLQKEKELKEEKKNLEQSLPFEEQKIFSFRKK